MGKPMPCSVGEVFGTDVGQRGHCPACSFSPANTHGDVVISCVQFGRGLYSAAQGLAECTICPVRTAARLGSPVRTPCTLGSNADSVGAAECTACLPGTVSSVGGSTVCERCPRGTYSNTTGAEACMTCPSGKTTDGTGSTREAACGCPPTTYWDSPSQVCRACGEGMICPGGAADDAQQGDGEGAGPAGVAAAGASG